MERSSAAFVAAFFFSFHINGTLAATLTVCSDGCSSTSLSAAVKQSSDGDEIRVRPGVYREAGAVVIDKSIAVRGTPGAILIGSGSENILSVTAGNVSVEGLELNDSGFSYTRELAGVRVEGVVGCSLKNNTFHNNAYAIYLADSENCLVEGNVISGSRRSEVEAGNGIHSWKGKHHQIQGNSVSGHRDGIYLEFTTDSSITDNRVSENERYGLHFMSSHRNTYRCNRFERNGAGVAVMYSREIVMADNTFANNRGVASYGLLLKDISKGDIRGNVFTDNTIGVYMEDTNRSKFSGNQFVQNGFGLRILGNCDDNMLEHNTFADNTFDVATNSSRNPNTFAENFWSQYSGYDLNRDGTGDIPYRPVSLSSIVIEKLDSSYLLIKSPLFLMLDELEQAFPMMIPESLKDERPRIRPDQSSIGACSQ